MRNSKVDGKVLLVFLPPTLELYATPTPHFLLLACMAISPAHRVPCLNEINFLKGFKIEL